MPSLLAMMTCRKLLGERSDTILDRQRPLCRCLIVMFSHAGPLSHPDKHKIAFGHSVHNRSVPLILCNDAIATLDGGAMKPKFTIEISHSLGSILSGVQLQTRSVAELEGRRCLASPYSRNTSSVLLCFTCCGSQGPNSRPSTTKASMGALCCRAI